MKTRYDTILFDFDFTLADSLEGATECINYALSCLELPPYPEEKMASTIGHPMPEIFKMVAGSEDKEMLSKFRFHFLERSDEVMTDLISIFADAHETLSYLKEKEYKLGIVSTKQRYRIEEVLFKNNLHDEFHVIIGNEDVNNHKPHPEGLIKAVKSVSSSFPLYVGDHIIDAKAAEAAGMDFLAVLTGTTTRDDFAPHNPVLIIENLTELKSIL